MEATHTRMEYEKKENNSFLFQYGPTPGLDDFRYSLAEFLSKNYGSPVSAQNLILTAGASHGMHLLWTLLLSPNALIIVDEATYMIALESLAEFPGFKVVSCPWETDGPNIKAMEEILVTNDVREPCNSRYLCMYFTIPVFHNPTGVTYSREKCRDLIRLSRKYHCLIACDDVYNLLNYSEDGDKRVPRMISMDDSIHKDYRGSVISNGSFSKIFSPGVRVGWIECPMWVNEVLKNRLGIIVLFYLL